MLRHAKFINFCQTRRRRTIIAPPIAKRKSLFWHVLPAMECVSYIVGFVDISLDPSGRFIFFVPDALIDDRAFFPAK